MPTKNRDRQKNAAVVRWIETRDPGQIRLPDEVVPEAIEDLAEAAGVLAERFTLLVSPGSPGIVLNPPTKPGRSLSCATAVTLLALIRAYEDFPVLTADESLLPCGGFADADWLSRQIEALTRSTPLLFSPSPNDLRQAIRRLKEALLRLLGRNDFVESSYGIGYRFRVWPSLITAIVVARG